MLTICFILKDTRTCINSSDICLNRFDNNYKQQTKHALKIYTMTYQIILGESFF